MVTSKKHEHFGTHDDFGGHDFGPTEYCGCDFLSVPEIPASGTTVHI